MNFEKKTWTEKHGSHAKVISKIISNIREAPDLGDVIDPEIKSAKGSEQVKNPNLIQRIKQERKALQLRLVAKKIYGAE